MSDYLSVVFEFVKFVVRRCFFVFTEFKLFKETSWKHYFMVSSENVTYLFKQRFGYLFDFVYSAKSVFTMLTKDNFEKMGSGVRLGFVHYFCQSHA